MTPVAPALDTLLRDFEQLDLSQYEAMVMVALMRLGSANTLSLARQSGVPRTSTYQVLEELSSKGLAQRLSVEGPAVWTLSPRDQLFERLDAIQEKRLREYKAHSAQVRELVDQTFPADVNTVAGPYVHVLHSAAQSAAAWDRLVQEAESELLVFNRPPYSFTPEEVNSVVLDAAGRGVETMALYEAEQWHMPESAAFREVMEAYHAAGVQGRLVDRLPIKLAVADRRVSLVAMTDAAPPDVGFPTTLLVEHEGYAAVQAEAFRRLWDGGIEVGSGETTSATMSRRSKKAKQVAARPTSRVADNDAS